MIRSFVISIVALSLLLTTSCRRRKAEPPVPAAPAPDQTTTPLTSPQAAPEAGSTLAPATGADPSAEAKRFQTRAERNDAWIGKLAGNDPVARTKALSEIQAAKLSPAELAELRKQAATYGVKIP